MHQQEGDCPALQWASQYPDGKCDSHEPWTELFSISRNRSPQNPICSPIGPPPNLSLVRSSHEGMPLPSTLRWKSKKCALWSAGLALGFRV